MARKTTPAGDFTPAGVVLVRPDSIHERPLLAPSERQLLRLRAARLMGPEGIHLRDLVDKWSRLMDHSRDQAVKLEHIEET